MEHRGALCHKVGREEKRTCQSDEGTVLKEGCVHCNEDGRGGNGQSEGGTAPQMLLWEPEWKEKTNGLTPSKKSTGIDGSKTPGKKDSEELNKGGKRHFWQDHPPCRFQEDQSAQGPTGATQRSRRRRE